MPNAADNLLFKSGAINSQLESLVRQRVKKTLQLPSLVPDHLHTAQLKRKQSSSANGQTPYVYTIKPTSNAFNSLISSTSNYINKLTFAILYCITSKFYSFILQKYIRSYYFLQKAQIIRANYHFIQSKRGQCVSY